jgi:hypothetical protein
MRVQPSPHTNWVLDLRDVRKRVRRVLLSLLLAPATTKKDEALKPTKTHYPSNPKPSFKPKRDVKKETPKPKKEAFVCMFCGRADHLDEFYFHRKRIEKMRFDYARNSYRDEFSDFPSRSFSRASPHTSSRALSHFSHGPNHGSYGFGSRENNFVPRHFGYDTRPHRCDRFPRRPNFPAGGSHTHTEPRHLDGPCLPCRDSRPTRPNGEVQRIMKTLQVAWLSAGFLRFISLTPALSHRPLLVLCRCWTEAWRTSGS